MAWLGRAVHSESGVIVCAAADHFTLWRCQTLRELNRIAVSSTPPVAKAGPEPRLRRGKQEAQQANSPPGQSSKNPRQATPAQKHPVAQRLTPEFILDFGLWTLDFGLGGCEVLVPAQVREWLLGLRALARYIGYFDGNIKTSSIIFVPQVGHQLRNALILDAGKSQ
jgi:hypothetical protein